MKLEDSSGSSFELKIVGYQFPKLHYAEYDSNWLLIQIDVRSPLGPWKSTDPCLLTYEVEELASWLEKVDKGESPEERIEFIEPNLSFQVLEEGPDVRKLRVYFELECRPSWAASSAAWEEDLWIELKLSELDVHAAAGELRRQLKRYPQRARI